MSSKFAPEATSVMLKIMDATEMASPFTSTEKPPRTWLL